MPHSIAMTSINFMFWMLLPMHVFSSALFYVHQAIVTESNISTTAMRPFAFSFAVYVWTALAWFAMWVCGAMTRDPYEDTGSNDQLFHVWRKQAMHKVRRKHTQYRLSAPPMIKPERRETMGGGRQRQPTTGSELL